MAYERVSSEAVLAGKIRKDFAWKVISDFSRYPGFMENVDKVETRESGPTEGMSEWFVTIEEAPLRWLEKDHFDRERHEIRFESVDGDFDQISGLWRLRDHEGRGIKVLFDVEYNLGIPVIEDVLGNVLREKMKGNMDSMLGAIGKELVGCQIEERRSARVPIGTHATLLLNDTPVRAYVVNVSGRGMMFYCDTQFSAPEIVVGVGKVKARAGKVFNEGNGRSIRIIFRDELSENDVSRMVKTLHGSAVRTRDRVVMEKDVELRAGTHSQVIHLIDISPRGMLVRSDAVLNLENGFQLAGASIGVGKICHDEAARTARVVFDHSVPAEKYRRLLKRLQDPSLVGSSQLELPI